MPRKPFPKQDAAEPEVCVSAAILLRTQRVLAGKRHGDCLTMAFMMGLDYRGCIRGFVTSKGRFLDRVEALALQRAAGVPSKMPSGYRDDFLRAEDLY